MFIYGVKLDILTRESMWTDLPLESQMDHLISFGAKVDTALLTPFTQLCAPPNLDNEGKDCKVGTAPRTTIATLLGATPS